MDSLCLMGPFREQILADAHFRVTIENQVKERDVEMMFALNDYGIPVDTVIHFLSGQNYERLRRAIRSGQITGSPWDFIEKLRNPGNAYKDRAFIPDLARRAGIKEKGMGVFMQNVTKKARDLMLEHVDLSEDPEKLKYLVTQAFIYVGRP